MTITAMLQVKSENLMTQKPSEKELKQVSDILKKHGFNILRHNRFGLSISAEVKDYQDIFGINILEDTFYSEAVIPLLPELKGLTGILEVAKKPQLF